MTPTSHTTGRTALIPLLTAGAVSVVALLWAYWTTLGDHAVKNGTDKKLMEMRYALKGYIADGLLFRMSSIDRDSPRAFLLQDRFAQEMLAAMAPETRLRIAGLQ